MAWVFGVDGERERILFGIVDFDFFRGRRGVLGLEEGEGALTDCALESYLPILPF